MPAGSGSPVLPNPNRAGGLCLALSGGGFRASLFHLGAFKRLDEFGLLSSVRTVSSVSGGSIIAACLADAMMKSPPTAGKPLANFPYLTEKAHKLTSYNLRRKILLKKVEPQHWGSSLPELVAKELEEHITGAKLPELPTTPRFMFVATDMVFGVDWIYSKDLAGDYLAGYTRDNLDKISIGYAAAASACFPPVFAPLDSVLKGSALKEGAAVGRDADLCRERLRLSDGGVYDNMGLEPVWKDAEVLLVSDAGGPFEFAPDRGTVSDVKRYPDIMGNQARALRKRWLVSSFISGQGPGKPGLKGTYWETGNTRKTYNQNDKAGYSADVARAIAHIRTDLDAFSLAEAAILENHGYLLADAAINAHLKDLPKAVPPLSPPYPDWLDNTKALAALKDSSHQHL